MAIVGNRAESVQCDETRTAYGGAASVHETAIRLRARGMDAERATYEPRKVNMARYEAMKKMPAVSNEPPAT